MSYCLSRHDVRDCKQEFAMHNDFRTFPLPGPAPIAALLQHHQQPFGEERREFVSLAVDQGVQEDGSPNVAPTPGEQAVMAAHGIQFDGRGFRFAGFRYDRLIDAVRQSRRAGQGCE
jgi:hypothetical protein